MNPILLIFFGILFTTGLAIIGGTTVFFVRKEINPKLKSVFLGVASGVMLAAVFFSLIIPSLAILPEDQGYNTDPIPNFVPVIIGVGVGVLTLFLLDKIIPHAHRDAKNIEASEGIPTQKINMNMKMWLADIIHNVPEGLVIGLTISAAAFATGGPLISGIVGMALGMGIQNLPETAAVALSLQSEQTSRVKSFFLVVASSLVETLFAIIGSLIIGFGGSIGFLMPWILSFAGGAMLYVVIDELIPQFSQGPAQSYGTWGLVFGFLAMLALEFIPF